MCSFLTVSEAHTLVRHTQYYNNLNQLWLYLPAGLSRYPRLSLFGGTVSLFALRSRLGRRLFRRAAPTNRLLGITTTRCSLAAALGILLRGLPFRRVHILLVCVRIARPSTILLRAIFLHWCMRRRATALAAGRGRGRGSLLLALAGFWGQFAQD